MNKLGFALCLSLAGCSGAGLSIGEPPPPPAPSTPLALAAGQGATSIAVDGAALYFANELRGTIGRVDKTTGAVTLLATGEIEPKQIRVHGGRLFWAAREFRGSDPSAIRTVDASGGPIEVAARSPFAIFSFAVDDSGLYWPSLAEASGIMWSTNAATAPRLLGALPEPPIAIEVRAGHLFALTNYEVYDIVLASAPGAWKRSNDQIAYLFGLAVGDSGAYLLANGGLGLLPPGGGAIRTLAPSARSDGGLAVDDQSIYFLIDRAISKAEKSGGAPRTLATLSGERATMLAVDADSLYWIDGDSIFRLRKD